MDFLFELIFEILLNVVLEILAEVGLQSVKAAFEKREERNPFLAAFGYLILGLIAGGVSLLLFPHPFRRSQRFHGISLLIIPLLGGAAMSVLGMLRRRRGKSLILLDSFVYGAIFAFAMALLRYLFTT